MIAIDLIGRRFGRLLVIKKAEILNKKAYWLCECDCGATKTIRGSHLSAGKIISCGCHRIQVNAARLKTHGLSKTRVYRIWRDMINRCHYEKYPERHLYGGRGIKVCDRWRNSFEAFLADMGLPGNDMSIDRIDVNGNYEPNNCRWAKADTQARNRRPASRNPRARIIECGGEKRSLAEWSRETGLSAKAIEGRLRRGWDVKDALTIPPKDITMPHYKPTNESRKVAA